MKRRISIKRVIPNPVGPDGTPLTIPDHLFEDWIDLQWVRSIRVFPVLEKADGGKTKIVSIMTFLEVQGGTKFPLSPAMSGSSDVATMPSEMVPIGQVLQVTNGTLEKLDTYLQDLRNKLKDQSVEAIELGFQNIEP